MVEDRNPLLHIFCSSVNPKKGNVTLQKNTRLTNVISGGNSLHPILYEYGNLKVYSYGLMMVIGYFAALTFIYLFAPRAKMKRSDAVDLSILVFVFGIIGSRLVYVFLNFDQYSNDLSSIFEFQKGGLSWHGGLLGAAVIIIIYTGLKRYNLARVSDLMFTSSILGLGFGRIGCFLNGCCFGKPCDLPWAVTFPHHNHPIPVHPTQIYEMLFDFGGFAFLIYWWNKRKFNGENTLMMLGIYSVIRFGVEFFRYNTPDQMVSGLSYAQWVSIAIMLVTFTIIIIKRKKQVKLSALDEETTSDEPAAPGEVTSSEETE